MYQELNRKVSFCQQTEVRIQSNEMCDTKIYHSIESQCMRIIPSTECGIPYRLIIRFINFTEHRILNKMHNWISNRIWNLMMTIRSSKIKWWYDFTNLQVFVHTCDSEHKNCACRINPPTLQFATRAKGAVTGKRTLTQSSHPWTAAFSTATQPFCLKRISWRTLANKYTRA